MGKTSIEWADFSFNHVIGCTKVAAGCANCYAESFAKRYKNATWGPNGTRVMTSERYWKKPLKWNEEAHAAGVRKRVFCASLADVFEEWEGDIQHHNGPRLWVSRKGNFYTPETPQGDFMGMRPATMNDVRARLFALIDATPWLDWLLLTKRPENIPEFWPRGRYVDGTYVPCDSDIGYRQNVWLLTSVATQEDADRNVPLLLGCRDLAPVLGLSIEPLLGPIQLSPYLTSDGQVRVSQGVDLDWVIVGGESGPGARPMNPQWAQSIRDQCQAAGVPFHFKQWGEFVPELHPAWTHEAPQSDAFVEIVEYPEGKDYRGLYMARVGKKVAGRELDGRTWDEFPEVRR